MSICNIFKFIFSRDYIILHNRLTMLQMDLQISLNHPADIMVLHKKINDSPLLSCGFV